MLYVPEELILREACRNDAVCSCLPEQVSKHAPCTYATALYTEDGDGVMGTSNEHVKTCTNRMNQPLEKKSFVMTLKCLE